MVKVNLKFMSHGNARIFGKNELQAIVLVASIFQTRNFVRNRGVFEWLRGDTGMKLRVDAWFPDQNLVVEYHGRQHFQPNKFMDRRKGRAKQRVKYTLLRQKLIPKHGIKLLELRYNESLTEEYIRTRLISMGYKVKKLKN
jgi:hypothetical protein